MSWKIHGSVWLIPVDLFNGLKQHFHEIYIYTPTHVVSDYISICSTKH